MIMKIIIFPFLDGYDEHAVVKSSAFQYYVLAFRAIVDYIFLCTSFGIKLMVVISMQANKMKWSANNSVT